MPRPRHPATYLPLSDGTPYRPQKQIRSLPEGLLLVALRQNTDLHNVVADLGARYRLPTTFISSSHPNHTAVRTQLRVMRANTVAFVREGQCLWCMEVHTSHGGLTTAVRLLELRIAHATMKLRPAA